VRIKSIAVGVYQTNCYICSGNDVNTAIVIDPGDEADRIIEAIGDYKVTHILLTHGHADHIGAVAALKDYTNADILIHAADAHLLYDNDNHLARLLGIDYVPIKADGFLNDGAIIDVGWAQAKVIHTPGHTAGSVCININEALFTGDTLFAGSVGRTDLPGGDTTQLMTSLVKLITVVDDDMVVYPGHGPHSTIKHEKANNPFLIGTSNNHGR